MNDDNSVKLTLLLLANNQMTPALVVAASKLQQFKNQVSNLNPNLGTLTGSLGSATGMAATFGSALAGVGLAAITTGALAAAGAVWKLNGAMESAGKFQTRTIMTSSDIASQLAVPIEEATKRVENMQQRLAKSAANLPGVTQDYVDLFNVLGGTSATVFKGRPDEWAKQTEDMVTRIGVLAAGSGVDGQQAGSVIGRAISGAAGFGELATNDIIQKNTLFRQAILDNLTKLGKSQDDWKELTSDQRFKVLQEALKVATPDSLINKFNGTYESVTQGFMTYWFDPLSGVFGVLKKVNTENGGIKTALQSWTEMLMAFNALGSAVGEVMGFDVDEPMRVLIEFLDAFSSIVRHTAAAIKLAKFGNNANIGNLEEIRAIILNFINGAIQSFSNSVMNWDTGMSANGMKSLMDGLSSLFQGINWGDAGMAIGVFISKTLIVLLDALFSGAFLNLLGSFSKAVTSLLTGVVLGFIANTVMEIAKGVVDLFKGLINGLVGIWNSVVGMFTGFFRGIADKLRGVATGLSNFGANPVQAVTGMVVEGAKNIPIVGEGVKLLDKLGVFGNKEGANSVDGKLTQPQSGTTAPLVQPNSAVTNNKVATNNVFAPNISAVSNTEQALAGDILDQLGRAYGAFQAGMA